MKQRYMAMCPRLTRGAAVCDRTAGKARASMRASGSQSRSVSCPTLRLLGLDWLVADRPRSRPARPRRPARFAPQSSVTSRNGYAPLRVCATTRPRSSHSGRPESARSPQDLARQSPGRASAPLRGHRSHAPLSHGCKNDRGASAHGCHSRGHLTESRAHRFEEKLVKEAGKSAALSFRQRNQFEVPQLGRRACEPGTGTGTEKRYRDPARDRASASAQ
jgi:hypothetical protein